MTFVTGTGFVASPKDKGGRPSRNAKKHGLIAEAAKNSEVGATAAAKGVHAIYYGDAAKFEGDEYRSQIKYLSNLIRVCRKGLLVID